MTEPYELRANDPIIVSIPREVQPYLSFDETEAKFIWTDDSEAMDLKYESFRIEVTLTNDQGTSGNFYFSV